MQYLAVEPGEALSPYVSTIWLFEGSGFEYARERVLPSGELQLLVNLDQDELRWWTGDRFEVRHTIGGACVSGTFDSAIAIDTLEQRAIMGACFHPGGAPAVLGAPALAFHNTCVSLDALGFSALRERLLEARAMGAGAALKAFEWALQQRLVPRQDRAVVMATAALGQGATVRAIEQRLGWSPKALRRRFYEQVGLLPKTFARVVRLQQVLGRMKRNEPWAQIAAGCGYTDQAHLIRDFRALTKTTPARYSARNANDLNHAPLDEPGVD